MNIVRASAVVVLLFSLCSADMAQQKAMLVGIAQECKITENASDDDMVKLVQKKAPDTTEGKCLFTCILEQMDVVRQNVITFYLRFLRNNQNIDSRWKAQ